MKNNCWDAMNCGKGPDSDQVCPAASHELSHGYLDGEMGGRSCFYIQGTYCKNDDSPDDGEMTEKLLNQCLDCKFFKEVQVQEGVNSNIFFYLKHLHENVEDDVDRINLLVRIASGQKEKKEY